MCKHYTISYHMTNTSLTNFVGFTDYHNADLQELQDALMTADEQDLSLIHVKLLSLNRHIETIEGDGNCLF